MTVQQFRDAKACGQEATAECPLCGSVVEIVEATVTESVAFASLVHGTDPIRYEARERQCVVAACTGCEFILEIK